jgi:hypothetical protein
MKIMHKKKIFLITAAIILSMFAAKAQTPGGVNNAGYTWAAWLTPDSYNSGTWTNLWTGTGSVGNFAGATTAPAKLNTGGYNFHPAVYFTKSGSGIGSSGAPNQLFSNGAYSMGSGDNVTMFFVLRRTVTDYWDCLFGLGNRDVYNQMSWRSSSNQNLSAYWGSTSERNLGSVSAGIFVMDNANISASNAMNIYKNGTLSTAQATQWNGSTNRGDGKVALGGGRNDTRFYGYRGHIQEFIMLKKSGNGHLDAVDIQKIHSYLALKYGLKLENSDNYIASDGTSVWTRDAAYNAHIFGIGRDNASSLFQKQSVSATDQQTTMFIGNKLETLNSQNNASLGDKEFLVLGSNGATGILPANIPGGTQYENGDITGTGLNYQSSAIYKAQLTNLSSMEVKLKLNLDYLYVFVSKDGNFTPSQTKIYPVNQVDHIATIDINQEYKYIRYAGFSTGPGGVSSNLKLWLRADDLSSLTIQNLPLSDPKLTNYPFPVVNGEAPAVQEWRDLLRGQTYSWAAGPASAIHRIPVYEPDNLMMNYHPSVRFWASGSSYAAYLSNPNGILTTKQPAAAGNYHTAYFVTSHNFNTHDWGYTMMFGNVNPIGNYDGPGYSMLRTSNKIVGRFRTVGSQVEGSQHLFNIGATSINGFFQVDNKMLFRFNGKEDYGSPNISFGTFDMRAASTLAIGYDEDRAMMGVMSEVIIFEKQLSTDETRKLESYLAIKYGVTLQPSNTSTNRFDYQLSDGSTFWRGDVPTSDPTYGKYATFYNNVAAVIRDDAAKLNNTQSQSTNAGSILHMGVAGEKLGSKFNVAELPNDKEVVVWGSNSEEGVESVTRGPCNDFEYIFKKKWLVRKITKGNRSIAMLVGAKDNSGNYLGSSVSAAISAMYQGLASGHDVSMLVADSPEKLVPNGDFKVIPMKYIDGEQQCTYIFNDSCTYITFGYKQTINGCYADVEFEGTKTYNWNTQWTSQNYNLNGAGEKTISKTQVDLGDNVKVSTKVVYDNSVRANNRYPSSVSSPRNALQIQRRYGTVTVSKVTTTIEFNTPVSPEFFISGLDSRDRQYDQVIITAECPGSVAIPRLMYASNESSSTYQISGNKASVTKNRSASATDRNGTLNVSFDNCVTKLVIEYIIHRDRVTSSVQDIFISPITLRKGLRSPSFNEDGLSFTKQVNKHDVTTCETVEYTFRIGNTNKAAKYAHFTDVLPDKMKWKVESVGLDMINASNNSLKLNSYGGTNTLDIDSLLVPCTSQTLFKATAVFDEDTPTETYANRAVITYERINEENQLEDHILKSEDAERKDTLTRVNVTWEERYDTVKSVAVPSPSRYAAKREVTVTLKVTNPNATNVNLTHLYLNWDAGFKYVSGSYTGVSDSKVIPESSDSTVLLIGGTDESLGFNLPNGESVFSFRLLAPDKNDLEYEIDEDTGLPTTEVIPLNVSYLFTSEGDNLCVLESISGLLGEVFIPYGGSKTHIIVNKHVSTKVSK